MEPVSGDYVKKQQHIRPSFVVDSNDPVKLEDVQGDPMYGLNKPFGWYICADIEDTSLFKNFLKDYTPMVTSAASVNTFRVKFRALRQLNNGIKPSVATLKSEITQDLNCFNIAFGHTGLQKLLGTKLGKLFGEHTAFVDGLPAFGALNDNNKPPSWKVGSTNPDVFLIVQGDDKADVDAFKEKLLSDLATHGAKVSHSQDVARLPDPSGREHFGFQDGISQPAIRGVDANTKQLLYPRYISPKDTRSDSYSLPGQHLVPTGEIFLGYKNLNDFTAGPSGGTSQPIPDWTVNGTFVVYRRMNQDVPKLWNFVRDHAKQYNVDEEYLASQMFGRFKSGAPVMRTPEKDDYALGQNNFANNAFQYDAVYKKPQLVPGSGSDPFPEQSKSDPNDFGLVCPVSAHLRKVNPRDTSTDLGAPELTLGKRIVRRGIPFGAAIKDPYTEDGVERGLAFISYQANIREQFEFLLTNWVNSTMQPGNNNAGIDPIIGQTADPNKKYCTVNVGNKQQRVTLDSEFVTITGGGYFFMPSISGLKYLQE